MTRIRSRLETVVFLLILVLPFAAIFLAQSRLVHSEKAKQAQQPAGNQLPYIFNGFPYLQVSGDTLSRHNAAEAFQKLVHPDDLPVILADEQKMWHGARDHFFREFRIAPSVSIRNFSNMHE